MDAASPFQPYRTDAADKRRQGDLRDAMQMICDACGYQWWAPTGDVCPHCHQGGRCRVVLTQFLDYRRV